MLKTYEEVLKVTNDLVNIESIVNTEGEIDISKSLAKTIANLPYFQKIQTMCLLHKRSMMRLSDITYLLL